MSQALTIRYLEERRKQSIDAGKLGGLVKNSGYHYERDHCDLETDSCDEEPTTSDEEFIASSEDDSSEDDSNEEE